MAVPRRLPPSRLVHLRAVEAHAALSQPRLHTEPGVPRPGASPPPCSLTRSRSRAVQKPTSFCRRACSWAVPWWSTMRRRYVYTAMATRRLLFSTHSLRGHGPAVCTARRRPRPQLRGLRNAGDWPGGRVFGSLTSHSHCHCLPRAVAWLRRGRLPAARPGARGGQPPDESSSSLPHNALASSKIVLRWLLHSNTDGHLAWAEHCARCQGQTWAVTSTRLRLGERCAASLSRQLSRCGVRPPGGHRDPARALEVSEQHVGPSIMPVASSRPGHQPSPAV